MMNKDIFLLIMLVGIGCFIVSVILYAFNRAKYYQLLSLFQKEHVFSAPYSFHCLIGFLGAFPVAYFFLCLRSKKKIFFLDRSSEAYNFFDKHVSTSIGWMKYFYYLWLVSMLCFGVLFFFAVILEVKARYL